MSCKKYGAAGVVVVVVVFVVVDNVGRAFLPSMLH